MYKFSMLSRDTVSFQAKSKNLVKDLYQITSDTKCFSSFIKEAIQNPRKSQETTKILLNQAGSTNNFLKRIYFLQYPLEKPVFRRGH